MESDFARFTHLDSDGRANMVDVGEKAATKRRALAEGFIKMSAGCFEALMGGNVKKGDVFAAARIAGIMAVKKTPEFIPLCHTILIDKARVDFEALDGECKIRAVCEVKTFGVTGVEMEALTGVSVSLLTIYDMLKAADKSMEICDIRLLEKDGGKSGSWRRGND